MEIEKTLVASTAHVLRQDIDSISQFQDIMILEYEYGMIFRLEEDAIDNFSSDMFSSGLKMLILFGVSLGCSYLKLDSDGPLYEEFPQYVW